MRMMSIASVLRNLDAGTQRRLARDQGCSVRALPRKLGWAALVAGLTRKQVADVLYEHMDETNLKILAVHGFETAGKSPVQFEPTQTGWSRSKPVTGIMNDIAGWRAAPEALSQEAWATVVEKLRCVGLELEDEAYPERGIKGSVRVRWIFGKP